MDLAAHLQAAANGQAAEPQKPEAVPAHQIPLRLWETDSAWLIEADIPGVDPAQVSIEFFQEKLTIQYDRPTAAEDQKATYDNRGYGLHQRVIRVTDEVNADGITAAAKLGVLQISLPKCAASQPKKIAVNLV
jgi:HSP20 family protein